MELFVRRFAFVILNYKTYNDTLELLENLKEQDWYEKTNIYVVENGSNNESASKLKEAQNIYNFELIVSDINLGFAKGNNVGISKAIQTGCKFIICSNSDINLQPQSDFLNKIKSVFESNNTIAVIAPAIKNLDGVYQNPFRKDTFSKKEILKMKLFYLSYFYKLYYFIRVYIVYALITYLAKKRKAKEVSSLSPLSDSDYIYAPHGSFVIFTPTFFNYFNGFDEHTFLYCEEYLLAEMLRSKELSCYFENSLHVLHKESRTTDSIVKDYKEKVKFTLRHTFESCKYFSKIVKA